ncbi:MAG: outer membrane protein assembly factor BamB [Burkholderiales bacterium]|nr:outer membrane protein assembly factor BamB [Burkholderiales bacterium]
MTARSVRAWPLLVIAATLAGCSSMPSWLGGSEKKVQPLPAIEGQAGASVQWQASLGSKQGSALIPAVFNGRVYAAHPSGALVVLDEKTGAVQGRWQAPAGKGALSGGVAAGGDLVVVGTDKAELIAFGPNGTVRWSARASSELVSPAAIFDDAVLVLGGDGGISAFDPKTGNRKWVIQRALPPLTVRSSAIPIAVRGAAFVGTAQGKLLAIDPSNGNIGWESTVAAPKGTSELERLVDVTGRPVVDAERVCASAYQGRVACFDLIRGTLLWSRDVSALTGPQLDARHVYIVDDKGIAQAFDKSTGGTVWKRDALAGRRATGSVLIGGYFAIQDADGVLHLLDTASGKIAGRALGEAFAANVEPVAAGDGALIQTRSGQVVSVSAR